MSQRPRGALPLLLMLAAACTAEQRPQATGGESDATRALATGAAVVPQERLEAGVRVLEHAADAFERAPQFTVDPAPVAVLGRGSDEGTYDLTWALSVAPLRDGRVATFSPIGSRLLVFAADGRGERVVGRQGQGPGEFTRGSGLVVLTGDTLLLADDANGRLNWIHADAGVVRFEPVADRQGLQRFSRFYGVLPDGQVLVGRGGLVQRAMPDTVVRPPTPVGLLDPRNGSIREIAQVPDLELVQVETRYRGRVATGTEVLRLGRRAHLAVLDTFVVTAHGDGYVLDLRRPDGTLAGRIRMPLGRRAVTQAMRDAIIADELERLEEGGGERPVDPEESRRQAREAPFADSLPPYSRVLGASDGLLWVVDAVAPGDTAWSATAFRADGAIARRLRGSGEVLPMAFAGDRVFVRTTEADGVVRITAHRIVPAR